MANNTKYQPAPQRDSFEEPNYTQAPPSYQAERSGHHDILGGPRSEDDNVPDDFKVENGFFYTSKKLRGKMRRFLTWTIVWRLRLRGYVAD